MPITNKTKWNKYVAINKDGYSKACVKVAKKVMEILDENKKPLKNGYYPDAQTAHGIICKADNIVKEGLSGFQASAIALMVKECHSRGDEFYKSYKQKIKSKSLKTK